MDQKVLPYDIWASMAAKGLRMVNYGAIAPIFFLYCVELGFSMLQVGGLLAGILVGDAVVSVYLTTSADRLGRRRVLVVGSLLKVVAGVVFAWSSDFWVLLAAGIVGVISTSGGECGPLMPVENAVLSDAYERHAAETYSAAGMATLFGWYNAVGYVAQAAGTLLSGVTVVALQSPRGAHLSALSAYRLVFVAYACIGGVMGVLYFFLSPRAEAAAPPPTPAADAKGGASDNDGHDGLADDTARDEAVAEEGREVEAEEDLPPQSCCRVWCGLRRTRSVHVITRLSLMFALDSIADAFLLQTWIAYWFHATWGFNPAILGALLMGANAAAGLSALATPPLVHRFGPMFTMIATHFPSNILLLLVPFMPTAWAASAMLVARFCISQMDEPARDTYVNSVVASDEKSAANGISGLARSLGMSFAPLAVGYLSTDTHNKLLFASPFLIAAVLKCLYDIVLYGLYLLDDSMHTHEADSPEEAKQALLAPSDRRDP